MESISNAANTFSKAVFGTPESKEEPQSGVQGNPAKGEPFDGGNMSPAGSDEVKDASGPTTEKGSSVQPGDSTKAQNDVRDPSNPTTDPETAADRKDVDDSGKGAPAVKGPGPKPLETIAKEQGGDAGNLDTKTKTPADDKDGAAPAGDGNDDGPQSKSKGEGTGEKWVKTSGLKADGGDFDATNPGAAKEADRLLEQKGLHFSGSNTGAALQTDEGTEADTTGTSPGGKEKKSLKDKIKEKLHRS